ncbi:MAG: aldo/keto reductase [Nitrospina sp.]|jgi:aryl-alcohol dehydrogenase-like predicted oxidoreductase|nr:aldo/keto reductase [Nitrospina sp.]MBT5632429.1 aldo/keto reductase [Nitrospina sp.]
MIYGRVDGINKDWSRITLGCWQIAPSGGWGDICPPEDADKVVQTALDNGITAFDTAEGYGDGESERRLGKALGSQKDSVIIISKIWPDAELTFKAYQHCLNNSLKALGRDYVDLYLIHWPGSYFNTREKSARLAEFMHKIKQSGKATTVGLSNFQSRDLTLLGNELQKFSMNEVPYSLLDRAYEGETLSLCQKAGIPYMAFSPTAQGLLARPMSREDLRMPTRKNHFLYQSQVYPHAQKVWETVRDIARELNRKPVEVALAWVLTRDNIFTAIVGSRKPLQVLEFAQSAELKLSPDSLLRLTTASDQFPMVKKGH